MVGVFFMGWGSGGGGKWVELMKLYIKKFIEQKAYKYPFIRKIIIRRVSNAVMLG